MNEYEKQANNFLHATGTKLTVELAENQTAPIWAERDYYGKQYNVTLENPKGRYVFPFWDSVYNRETFEAIELLNSSRSFQPNTNQEYKAIDLLKERLKIPKSATISFIRQKYEELKEQLNPTAYTILACLSLTYEDSFEDWADSFGYSTDSIRARESYNACIEQDRQLRRLFTSEQLERLEEIQ